MPPLKEFFHVSKYHYGHIVNVYGYKELHF